MDYLKLFSNCFFVKGYSRIAIVDSQREQIFFVPLTFQQLIDESNNSINIAEIRQKLETNSLATFEEYIDYIIQNELGFYCTAENLQRFPKISVEWDFPSVITNCLIDCDSNSLDLFDEFFFSQLEQLCCNHIQLRFYAEPNKISLENLLYRINRSQIKSIELVLPGNDDLSDEKVVSEFLSNHLKITNLILTSSNENKVLKVNEFTGTAFFVKNVVDSNLHCGVVDIQYFALNLPHFNEALKYNSCLNRKISIDCNGDIKNCPSMSKSFGNIKDTSLQDAISHPQFTKYWNISKDKIEKCKDCEFRYVCTDCRAFKENPDDMLSAPLKCGYNPYTNQWEQWSTNPLKQKSIEFYGLTTLS